MELILASASPRRKELLSYLGYPFKIVVSEIDETQMEDELPWDYVSRVSLNKNLAVSDKNRSAIVLSADTSVILGDKILGKPKTLLDSNLMLRNLSGKTHTVLTAFSIYNPCAYNTTTRVVESRVVFRYLSDQEIEKYSLTGEGLDKAGGYGFQNTAISFISSTEGSPSNIIGLPLADVKQELDRIYAIV
jgi:septum formation protein